MSVPGAISRYMMEVQAMATNNKNQSGAKGNNNSGFVWKKNLKAVVPCYWGDVDMAILRRAIDTVTRAGGAIMLGVTSDSGAYSICVLYGSDKVKEYPHSVSECEGLLTELAEQFLEELL